jgi:CIC family chloride channel protein
MIFELTRDYAIVVPLMIANMISFVISRRLQPVAVYEALALQDGIHFPRPVRERHSGRAVHTIMEWNIPVVPGSTPVSQVPSDARVFVVIDADGVEAAFAAEALKAHDSDTPLAMLIDEQTHYPHVHSDQPVEDALERMEEAGVGAIAVVDRADVHRVLGAVTLADARAAFRAKRNP